MGIVNVRLGGPAGPASRFNAPCDATRAKAFARKRDRFTKLVLLSWHLSLLFFLDLHCERPTPVTKAAGDDLAFVHRTVTGSEKATPASRSIGSCSCRRAFLGEAGGRGLAVSLPPLGLAAGCVLQLDLRPSFLLAQVKKEKKTSRPAASYSPSHPNLGSICTKGHQHL